MNVYIVLACVIVVVSGMLSSTTASGFPLIYCPPNPTPGLPTKMRKLCFAIVERVDTPQEEFSEGIELENNLNGLHAASPGEGEGEVMDTQLFGRGTKRQDVDHVFLRFGRRLGL